MRPPGVFETTSLILRRPALTSASARSFTTPEIWATPTTKIGSLAPSKVVRLLPGP